MKERKLSLEEAVNHENYLGEIDINSFYDNFVKQGFYCKISREDLEGRYRRSYEIFKHNEGKPAEVEPAPLAPEEILKKRVINESDVIDIEVDVAVMFSLGLSILKSVFPNAKVSNPY